LDLATGYDYGQFLFGSQGGKTDKGMEAKLHVSTALTAIAAPNKEAGNTDFECTDTNNCVKTGASAVCDTELTGYKLHFYDTTRNQLDTREFLNNAADQMCQKATTFMRWTNNNVDSPKNLQTNMNISIFNKKNDNLNVTNGVGLIGLAPDSEFFQYVESKTTWNDKEDTMQFSLSYSPNSGASKLMDTTNEDTWKQNQFIIKGKRNGGDITFESDLLKTGTNKDTWTVGFATFNLSDDSKNTGYTPADNTTQNVPLCLSSDYPYMMGLVDQASSAIVKNYFNKVCKDPSHPETCPESDASKDKVKKASIQLANKADKKADGYTKYDLTFETEDILYFNKDHFTPIVGQYIDKAELEMYGCDDSTQIVVGRPFLAKYEAVMTIHNKAGIKKTLAFIPNEGTSSIFLII